METGSAGFLDSFFFFLTALAPPVFSPVLVVFFEWLVVLGVFFEWFLMHFRWFGMFILVAFPVEFGVVGSTDNGLLDKIRIEVRFFMLECREAQSSQTSEF